MSTWGFKGFLKRFLEAPDAALYDDRSPSGRGRIRYNDVSKAFEASVDGGPYLPFSGGSGGDPMVVAATIADLEAAPVDELDNGSIASVLTVRDLWTLLPASPIPLDGITRVQAADGVRVWQRWGVPNLFWTIQDTWFIDPVNGDDEARGITLGSAIQTHAELRRRIGQLPITQVVIVNLVGANFAEPLIVDFNTDPALFGAVVYVGQRFEVSQAALTGATPHVNAPQVSRAFGTVTFAGDQSANTGRLMVALDGPVQGATGWAMGNSGGTNIIRTGPWKDAANFDVFPSVGNTIGFYDLTTVGEVYSTPGTLWGIYDVVGTSTLGISGGIENSATSLGVSRWDGTVFCSGRITMPGANVGDESFGCQFAGCFFRGDVRVLGGSTTNFFGSTFAGANSRLLVFGGTLGSLDTLAFGFGARLSVGSSSTILNAAFTDQGADDDCAEVNYGGTLRFTGNVWGRNITSGGAGRVLRCQQNAIMTYNVSSPPDFTANNQIQVANTAANLGALPVINTNNLCAITAGI